MKFLLLTYDPQGTDGPDVVPFHNEASAFAELKRATRARIVAQMCKTVEQLRDDIRASGTISAGL